LAARAGSDADRHGILTGRDPAASRSVPKHGRDAVEDSVDADVRPNQSLAPTFHAVGTGGVVLGTAAPHAHRAGAGSARRLGAAPPPMMARNIGARLSSRPHARPHGPPTVPRALVVLLLAVAPLMSGCGATVTPTATSSPAPSATHIGLDPCTLLTGVALGSALGSTVGAGQEHAMAEGGECDWLAAGGYSVTLSIEPLDAAAFASGKALGSVVPGLGDDAYLADISHGLHIAKDGMEAVLQVSGGKDTIHGSVVELTLAPTVVAGL
jgi:hypothetical protein